MSHLPGSFQIFSSNRSNQLEYECNVVRWYLLAYNTVVFFNCSSCPDSPSNIEAVFPSENCGNSVRISWDAPLGQQVDSYSVLCTGDDVPSLELIVSGSEKTAVVGPLDTTAIAYSCSVVATNQYGSSQASSVVEFITG